MTVMKELREKIQPLAFFVDLTLPKDANIYAKEYELYLPDKKTLQRKLKEWLDEEKDKNNEE